MTERLLTWWAEHKRDFPWRLNPNPYHVLVAEVMLQRTRADIVAKIFPQFLQEFQTPKEIIESPGRVRELLASLGLIHRIPRFMELMRLINDQYGGKVPDDFGKLMQLPGVGRYIANAVLCFGFGYDLPLVDANIARVLTRHFGLESRKRPHTENRLWDLAGSLVPKGRAKEFNWALIDFAALVCTGRKPKCATCPINETCSARQL